MSVKTSWLYLVCLLALWVPLLAQDEPAPTEPPPAPPAPAAAAAEPKPPAKADVYEPALHRWGAWTVSAAGWGPTLIGADEEVALNLSPTAGLQPIYQRGDTRIKVTGRVSYHLPHDKGTIVGQYDAMDNQDDFLSTTPGEFNYLETRAFPEFRGFFDDGFADGVSSSAIRRTREFRLEYQNKAFDSKWARGTWGVGFRELSHERALAIDYYALVPNMPPAIPPVAEFEDLVRLLPVPDTTGQSSDFNGHGLGASLDMEFPLHPRVSIVTGLSIGIVKGTIRSNYISRTSAYCLQVGNDCTYMTGQELFDFLASPPVDDDDPETPPVPTIADIQQESFGIQLNASNTSQMSTSFDVYAGVQVRIWRGLKVFVLLRDVSYNNVGTYVVPRSDGTTETTPLNVGYEGYALGVSWRF